jgi:hypothetical protein
VADVRKSRGLGVAVMTRTLAALAFVLVLAFSIAQSEPKEPLTPGLGEIMTLQQMRHYTNQSFVPPRNAETKSHKH